MMLKLTRSVIIAERLFTIQLFWKCLGLEVIRLLLCKITYN